MVALLAVTAGVGLMLAASPASAATLAGRIIASPRIPEPVSLVVPVDVGVCGTAGRISDPRLRISAERGLADTVVMVIDAESPPPYPRHESPPTIDQVGCAFEPHVLVVAPGETVHAKNSDAVLHSFRTRSERNRNINRAQLPNATFDIGFARPDLVRVGCDIHYWMSAVIVVAKHAFTTVSDAAGRFEINGLPPGEYRLSLLHERLGVRETTVRVGEAGGVLDYEWLPTEAELLALAEPTEPSSCCGRSGGCMAAAGGRGGEGAPACGKGGGDGASCGGMGAGGAGGAMGGGCCGGSVAGADDGESGGESGGEGGCAMMRLMQEQAAREGGTADGSSPANRRMPAGAGNAAQPGNAAGTAGAAAAGEAGAAMPAGCACQRARAAAAAAAAKKAEQEAGGARTNNAGQ